MIWFWHGATALIGLLVLAGLATIVVSHITAHRHFSKKNSHALNPPFPKVSLLKPVEGAGPDTYDALASFCRVDYPGEMEILIGTITADDSVVALAGRLQKEFPERDVRLVFANLIGVNRKTSIMETLWHNASGAFLFFSDADVFAPPDYLKQLVPLLAQPGVGCLTCLPRGIHADTPGGRMIALHYGFNYLPQWMLAQRTTGIQWAVGHTMAVPHRVLEKLGGFSQFLDHLADDYELGHRAAQLGLRVIVAPILLDCTMPQESFAQAFSRMQRWKRTIHRSRGRQFLGVVVTYPVFWALILALLHPLTAWAWSVLGLVLVFRWLFAARLQRVVILPGWPRVWWLLPVVDVVEGLTFFGAFLGNKICWGGRHYSLRKDGTLELRAAGAPSK